MDKKLVYITISDEGYSSFLEQFCKSHKLFSNIPLVCLTVNYEPTHIDYEGFSFISIHDEEISKFDLGAGDEVTNENERIDRLVSLKCKLLEISTKLGYDHFLYLDADCILNKNSDNFFRKMVSVKGDTKFPISTYFRSELSTTHTNPNRDTGGLFTDERERLYSYIPLHKFYGTEMHELWYKTSFCMFYNKECQWFFKEANEIIFDKSIPKEIYKYTIPQEDETVFNYLYSKYNFHDGISFTHTSDIFYNVPIWRFRRDYKASMLEGVSAVYHVKYHKSEDYNLYDDSQRNMVDAEAYDEFIEELDSFDIDVPQSVINNFSLVRTQKIDDSIRIEFNAKTSGNFEIICCSKEDPTIHHRFWLEGVVEGYNYFIQHANIRTSAMRAYVIGKDFELNGIISY